MLQVGTFEQQINDPEDLNTQHEQRGNFQTCENQIAIQRVNSKAKDL